MLMLFMISSNSNSALSLPKQSECNCFKKLMELSFKELVEKDVSSWIRMKRIFETDILGWVELLSCMFGLGKGALSMCGKLF